MNIDLYCQVKWAAKRPSRFQPNRPHPSAATPVSQPQRPHLSRNTPISGMPMLTPQLQHLNRRVWLSHRGCGSRGQEGRFHLHFCTAALPHAGLFGVAAGEDERLRAIVHAAHRLGRAEKQGKEGSNRFANRGGERAGCKGHVIGDWVRRAVTGGQVVRPPIR